MKKTLLLAAAACTLATHSADAKIWTPYVGIDYVYNDANYESPYHEQLANEFNAVSGSIGIKITTNLAVEAFYQQSGNESLVSHNHIFANDTLDTSVKYKSYGVDLVSDFINLDIVEVLTSVGLSRYEFDINRTYSGNGLYNAHDINLEGNALRLGLGGQINLTENIGIRAMGRYILTDISDIKTIKEFTVGLRYTF